MTRKYQSEARREQAGRTRSRIIATAVRLLLRHGLAALTIGGLAREAGVSPQTVYNSVGGKADVLRAAYDVTLAGDEEPVSMSERPEFQAVQSASDIPAFATAYARWSAAIYDRVGALLGVLIAPGAAADPLLEEFIAKINTERRTGNTHGVRPLVERGLLPPTLDLEAAVDAVWTLTAPDNWFRLVQQRGWSGEQYERWLAQMLTAALEAG